jgi:hypothetical protein
MNMSLDALIRLVISKVVQEKVSTPGSIVNTWDAFSKSREDAMLGNVGSAASSSGRQINGTSVNQRVILVAPGAHDSNQKIPADDCETGDGKVLSCARVVFKAHQR